MKSLHNRLLPIRKLRHSLEYANGIRRFEFFNFGRCVESTIFVDITDIINVYVNEFFFVKDSLNKGRKAFVSVRVYKYE